MMVRLNQNRSQLLLGCGSAALAMGLAAAPHAASAQAIQASETVVSGSITRDIVTSGSETIIVNTPVAVVNWTPDEDQGGNALDYLPTGNDVTFENSSNITDFAILNRILPATNGNVVVFDGTVISRLVDPLTGGTAPGGTVAFYSPTGIFVGSNAVFDVGNLILTTLDPDLASFDDFAQNGGQLQMFGQSGTTAQIIFLPGAQVTATAENSYFAVTAAEIQFFGDSSVNGSTAFIAGEQVNITVSNGLFDIQIPFGSTSNVPIQIDGDVGGPSSTGVAGDNHLIYAVAAAQSDPISLLFSGNLGFQPAASAGIVNGEIILSANYAVSGRSVDGGSVDGPLDQLFDGNSQLTDALGSIFMEDFASTSTILAIANEEVQVTAFNGPSSIDGNLLMVGRNFAELTASNNQTFNISGDVLVSSRQYGLVGALDVPADGDASGGEAFIDAFGGGVMVIDGNAFVTAEAFGGLDLNNGFAGSATGGRASVASNGGSLTINGDTTILAGADGIIAPSVAGAGDATGGVAQLFAALGGAVAINGDVIMGTSAFGSGANAGPGSTGGNAFGGTTVIQALSGGSLLVDGALAAEANAFGGGSEVAQTGAIGDAGEANLFIENNETITITGDLSLAAEGRGGGNLGGRGGDGLGGAARAFLPNDGSLSIGGLFVGSANGRGGDGIGGGDGFGGIAGAQAIVGSIDVGSDAIVDAVGIGGDSLDGFGGDGGNGNGGNSFIQADGTLSATATITVGGGAFLDSTGRGGRGGNGDGDTILAGNGGIGTGGQIGTPNQADPGFGGGAYLLAGGDNGNITVAGNSNIFNFGIGGDGGDGIFGQDGGDGGDGVGGTTQAGSSLLGLDGSVGAGTVNLGDISIFANGEGGTGGNGSGTGSIRGDGGNGQGFGAFFTAQAGSVTAGQVSASATGQGGDGDTGGNGTGGTRAGLFMNGGGAFTVGSFSGDAQGFGGNGDATGGIGQGGEASIGFQDGTGVITGSATVDATGTGGASGGGDGGEGIGGIADIAIFTAIAGNGTVGGHSTVVANGIGGDGGVGFTGGTGTGGEAFVRSQSGGSITLDSLQVVASGQGGSGVGANGGVGLGGLADLISIDAGSQLTILNGHMISGGALAQGFSLLSATGIGGESQGGTGVGGTGTGGEATVNAQDGGVITLPADPGSFGLNRVIARGVGGSSAVDGGTGGVGIGGLGVFEVSGGTINAGPVQLSTFGNGGTGSNASINVDGGDGVGGDSQINVEADGTITGEFAGGTAGGLGGNGTGTGNGGNASGGSASIFMDSGTLNLTGQSILVTQNFGGDGVIGGSSEVSTVDVAIVGGTLNILPNANGDARLVISGASFGGVGTSQGGDARGGDVSVLFSEATVTGGGLTVLADGRGGSSDDVGGLGQAGEVFVVGTDANISLSGEIQIAAEGFGGSGVTGGDALGGVASLDIFQTDFTVGPDANGLSEVLIESSGNAGDGSSQVGNATAGLSQLLMLDASIAAGSLLLASEAEAAPASTGVLGGVAAGGEIEAIIEGASELQVDRFALVAPATSGPGGTSAGGVVGLLIGGPAGDPDLNAGQVDIDVNATGADTNTAGEFLVDLRSGQLAVGSLFAGALGDPGTPAFGVSSIAANGGDLLVSDTMSISVTDDFDIEFTQGSIIGGPTILDPSASIDITSGGTISIIGDNDNFIGFGGLNMDLASRDIDVEDGARFGAVNLTLRSLNTDDPAIIGGNSGSDSPGPGEGYVLSQQEADRIEVDSFLFIQPLLTEAGPNDPDIIMRDITASGSLDDSASNITITTDSAQSGGIIRVEGAVVFTDAASTDQFGLFAPGGRIEMVTPGGVAVVDSAGNPSGNLFLGANQIWIADSDLIALLQDGSTFTGRNDQLSLAASGSDDPLGYLRGGAVTLEVGSQLLVRNTGTASEQGGILVGDGGLSIFAGGNSESSLDVFAYGARLDSSGNLVTGQTFFQEVNFNNDGSSTGSTLYTDQSEFNDCLINIGECDVTVEPEGPTNEEGVDPTIISINNPTVFEASISTAQPIETGEQESNNDFGIDFPGFVESEDVDEAGDIDDPVASGGDSSLYIFGGTVRVENDGNEEGED
ncbi:MAG: hypothetical protein ACX930_07870 [Erythrobacter sp.]